RGRRFRRGLVAEPGRGAPIMVEFEVERSVHAAADILRVLAGQRFAKGDVAVDRCRMEGPIGSCVEAQRRFRKHGRAATRAGVRIVCGRYAFLNGGTQDEGAGPNADRSIGVFLRSRREPLYGARAFSARVERLPLLTVERTGAPVGSGVCRPVFLHIQGAPRSGSGLWRAGGCPSSTRRA